MPRCSEREIWDTVLLHLDSAAEGLTAKQFYTIPTDLEKFGELYVTPLSDENQQIASHIQIYIYIVQNNRLIDIIKSISFSINHAYAFYLF